MGRAGMPCAQEKGNKATLEKKHMGRAGMPCPQEKGDKATFPPHSSLQWRIIGGGGGGLMKSYPPLAFPSPSGF